MSSPSYPVLWSVSPLHRSSRARRSRTRARPACCLALLPGCLSLILVVTVVGCMPAAQLTPLPDWEAASEDIGGQAGSGASAGTGGPAGPDAGTEVPDGSADLGLGDVAATRDLGEPAAGEFGASCGSNAECGSGHCLFGSCTRVCLDECPAGYACQDYAPAGADVERVCVPEARGLCLACQTDPDCRSIPGNTRAVLCVPGPAGRFCTLPCESDQECPAGSDCRPPRPGDTAVCVRDTDCPAVAGDDPDGGPSDPVDLGPADPVDLGPADPVDLGPADPVDGGEPPPREVCNGRDDDRDGLVDEGLDCGATLRVVYQLPASARHATLEGDVGPEGSWVVVPLAGVVVDLLLTGIPDGEHELLFRWQDAAGASRTSCSLVESGSPLLAAGLPRVWVNGRPATVTLQRGAGFGLPCRFRFSVGLYGQDLVWAEGPHQLGLSGSSVRTDCALLVGPLVGGWWSGAVLRRGADGHLHLDARPWEGLPTGTWALHVVPLDVCPPAARATLGRTLEEADLDFLPTWTTQEGDLSPVGRLVQFRIPEVGVGVRVTVHGGGWILPAGTFGPDGEESEANTEANRCRDGEVIPCQVGCDGLPDCLPAARAGAAICLRGAWSRCATIEPGQPAEEPTNGVDDDGDGFVDETRGDLLLLDGNFENNGEGWIPNDSMPMEGVPNADGQGVVVLGCGGSIVGRCAAQLLTQQPSTVPAPATWHLQWMHEGLDLVEGGTYLLRGRVRASVLKRFDVEIGDIADDCRSVGLYYGDGGTHLVAGPTWSTFVLSFTALRDIANARLTLGSGDQRGLLELDDVALTRWEP